MNNFIKFSDSAQKVLNYAGEITKKMNGNQIDNNFFTYNNAVVHRQGLGFRGFEKITIYNRRGQSLVRTYEPYRYGLLKSEVAPAFEHSYTYTVSALGRL